MIYHYCVKVSNIVQIYEYTYLDQGSPSSIKFKMEDLGILSTE
jgi:hypothetical protein